MTEVHDLVRWANAADAPATRQIGAHAVARVLVGLAVHADRRGDAWPSAQTLADEISGLSRRDVRNALDALEAAGLIGRNGRRKRATVYRLAVDVAGMPATSRQPEPDDPAGYPATSPEPAADEVAGEVAGEQAGYPATKGREGKNYRPPSPPAPNLAAVDGSAGGSDGDDDEQDDEQTARLGDRLDRDIGDVLDAAAAVTAVAEEAFGIDARRIAPADLRTLADRLAAVPDEHREGVVIEVIGSDPPEHVASPFGFIRHRLDRAAYRWPATEHPA